MEIKLSVSGNNGRAYPLVLEGDDAEKMVGKNIGETINGELIGLKGYKLKITGGSDKDGFPKKRAVKGTKRVKSLMKAAIGVRKIRGGEKKRKFVRGKMISRDTAQVNLKVVEEGEKSLSKVLSKEENGEEGETAEN